MISIAILCINLAIVIPAMFTRTIYDDVSKNGIINQDDKTSKDTDDVYFSPGKYLFGSSKNVGKSKQLDTTPFIYAINQKNITIRGKAILDGQGSEWWNDPSQNKPYFMYFHNTNNIVLEDFTIKNSPFMNIRPKQCENITIKGITIINPYNSRNTDGINCYSCKNVHISGVSISTGDDCVALDAGKERPSENIVITDSHMKWGHSGVGIGSAIQGGLHNITVSNCIFDGTDRGLYIKSMRGRGGRVENIHYKNITMQNIQKEGIVLNMLYDPHNQDGAMHNRNIHWEEFRDDGTPVFRNLRYDGVSGNSVMNPIFFVGLPESHIIDVDMKNINIKSKLPIFLNNTRDVVINGKKQPDHGF